MPGRKRKTVQIESDSDEAPDTADEVMAGSNSSGAKSLRDEFLRICKEHDPQGVPATTIEGILKKKYVIGEVVEVINSLLTECRITLHQSSTDPDTIIYKFQTAEEAAKLVGLAAADMLLYHHIQLSGNQGIWIRDIRRKTNLQQIEVKKILKTLMTRKLIKCERSIAGKNKKVYMAYDLEPAKDVTGGAWYTGSEFDAEFFALLYKMTHAYIKRHGGVHGVSCSDAAEYARNSGAFSVPCRDDDLAYVCYSLELDHLIEALPTKEEELLSDRNYELKWGGEEKGHLSLPLPSRKYRIRQYPKFKSPMIHIPCIICPLSKECEDEGMVNPRTCVYLKQWYSNDICINPEPDIEDILIHMEIPADIEVRNEKKTKKKHISSSSLSTTKHVNKKQKIDISASEEIYNTAIRSESDMIDESDFEEYVPVPISPIVNGVAQCNEAKPQKTWMPVLGPRKTWMPLGQ